MSFFARDHVFPHKWGNVTLAFFRKYPDERSPQVREVDTFRRSFDPKTGDLTTHRLIGCQNPIPSWLRAVGISERMYVVEKTVVNARNKTCVVRSQNITGSSLFVVEEKCTYRQDAAQPSATHYRQEAHMKAFLPFVSGKVESWSLDNFANKSQQGLQVLEDKCATILRDGISELIESLGKDHIALAQEVKPSPAMSSTPPGASKQ